MPALLREDMEAINTYIMGSKVNTKAADAVKNKWIVWWEENKRSGWDWYSQEEFDLARNFRNQFNLANAKSSTEKDAVKNQASSGVTSEEARGETKRSTSEGYYIVPEPPLISNTTKIGIIAAIAAVALGWVAKVAYIDPILTPVTMALGKAKTKKILSKHF